MLAIAVAGAQGDSSRVSFASPLAGQTLSGKQKWEVTVANGPPVEQVQFFVDDQSKPLWTEREAPYVFGGDLGVLDTSSLSNGTHVLAVTLYDKSAKPETFKQEFTVANGVTPTPTPTPTPPPSAPKVEFASPTGGQSLAGQVKWEATASGTVSRVEFFLDNASAPVWTEREAPYVFNGDAGLLDTTKLADGAHVLGLKAVASDGTTGEAKVTVNVANAVPTTTPPAAPVLESTPAKETTETSASFAFSTSTAGAQLECALDGAALAACASPKSYSGLTVGLHTFSVRAVAGGVASAVATYSWTISDPSPQPSTCASGEWKAEFFANSTLSSYPALTRCDAAVSFDWGNGQPAASVPADKFSARWVSTWTFPGGPIRFTVTGDDGVRLLIDGTVVLDKWLDQTPTTYSVDRTISTGSHKVALEYYENTGDATAKLSWASVASVAPPTITSSPTNPTTATTATFAFTSTSGSAFECALDGGSYTSCSSPKSYSGLAAGSHQFLVRTVVNSVASAPTAYSWQVSASTTPPSSGSVAFTGDWETGNTSQWTWGAQCSNVGDAVHARRTEPRDAQSRARRRYHRGRTLRRIDLPAYNGGNACETLRKRTLNLGSDDYYGIDVLLPG